MPEFALHYFLLRLVHLLQPTFRKKGRTVNYLKPYILFIHCSQKVSDI